MGSMLNAIYAFHLFFFISIMGQCSPIWHSGSLHRRHSGNPGSVAWCSPFQRRTCKNAPREKGVFYLFIIMIILSNSWNVSCQNSFNNHHYHPQRHDCHHHYDFVYDHNHHPYHDHKNCLTCLGRQGREKIKCLDQKERSCLGDEPCLA